MAGKRKEVTLDEDSYNAALVAWLQKPTASNVVFETGLSRKQVKQLIEEGIPELRFAPLPGADSSSKGRSKRKQAAMPTATVESAKAHLIARESADQHVTAMKHRLRELEGDAASLGQAADLAESRERLDQKSLALTQAEKQLDIEARRIANVTDRQVASDHIKRVATEESLARLSMRNALNVGAALELMTEKLLEGVENGSISLPKVLDVKTLSTLATSVDKLTSATERAIKIEKGKAGEVEDRMGIQIGILLSGCSEEELDGVIANQGELPERIRHTVNATVLEARTSGE